MPLIHLAVDVSEEVLEVLRWICAEGKSSAPCKDDLLDEFARSRLRACEHGGFVQVNDRVFLTPMGRLVLAAHDRPDTADARDKVVEAARKVCAADRALGEVSDAEGICQNGIDVATDLLDALPRLQDALDALDAAKQGKGEGL